MRYSGHEHAGNVLIAIAFYRSAIKYCAIRNRSGLMRLSTYCLQDISDLGNIYLWVWVTWAVCCNAETEGGSARALLEQAAGPQKAPPAPGLGFSKSYEVWRRPWGWGKLTWGSKWSEGWSKMNSGQQREQVSQSSLLELCLGALWPAPSCNLMWDKLIAPGSGTLWVWWWLVGFLVQLKTR